nr:DUF3168 domain-containing protein [Haloechinothrix aidingensis]
MTGDTALMDLVTGVYDEVPEDAELDYVRIGDVQSSPDNTHGRHGRQLVHTIHTWSRARSSRPGNRIGERLVALLARNHAALDTHVAGHAVYLIAHESTQQLRDPEPSIRHRVDRFRIYTAQED